MPILPAENAPSTSDGLIVDLSQLAEPFLQMRDIAPALSADQEQRICAYAKALFDMSWNRISRRYDHWKEADRAHDVYVPPDATDFREKAVIADTRAIADTVLTYLMAALGGRNPMFGLEGLNAKSRKPAAIIERILHQHMRQGAGEFRVAQLLNDAIRYGFAPTRVSWDGSKNTNKIINYDPRRCFPDPRVNWGDIDEMQFIGFVDYKSFDALRQSGLYPKLDYFPSIRHQRNRPIQGWKSNETSREEGRGLSIDPASADALNQSGGQYFTLGSARTINEVFVRLPGDLIGMPGVREVWAIITILDEDTVIRCQLNPYGRQFPIVMSALFNDSHKTFGAGLYDILLPLHDIATWLLRSRVDNVMAALNNLIFVDPSQVNISDLIDRNPWGLVRTLPGTRPGDGVNVVQVPDVTSSHWNDIQGLSEFKQRLSAASDAQQGIPSPGTPPTATEVQRLTQLGSQRLGVLSRIISATTIRPMVRMMVSNLQDMLTSKFSGSIPLNQSNSPEILRAGAQDGYVDFNVLDLQGDIDYLVVDGTLPLEPSRNVEAWMQILGIMQQTGLTMEYDGGAIAEEAIKAMGIPNIERFKLDPSRPMSPSQEISVMEKMRGASVMPQGDIDGQVSAGNLVPISEAQA
ncbi:MAG: hypothetical protein CMB77_07225 [Euryarchaeota archaeon]|nr:hypothetical protein [Euryarchaeota archaeon]